MPRRLDEELTAEDLSRPQRSPTPRDNRAMTAPPARVRSADDIRTVADVRGSGSVRIGLLRRTGRPVAIGAEHATVTLARLQSFTAALAAVEVSAGVLRHCLACLLPTHGAGDHRFKDGHADSDSGRNWWGIPKKRAGNHHRTTRPATVRRHQQSCAHPHWRLSCAGATASAGAESGGAGTGATCHRRMTAACARLVGVTSPSSAQPTFGLLDARICRSRCIAC